MERAQSGIYLGAHLSVSSGMSKMIREAVSLEADTVQFFSRNPRGAGSKAFDEKDAQKAWVLMDEHRFGPLVAHAPYILNAASPEVPTWELAVRMLTEDLLKISQMKVPYLVIHPGSRKQSSLEEGILRVVRALNMALAEAPQGMILLETMSGMGSEVGGCFEEMARIMDGLEDSSRVGICIDSCHMFAAGYPVHEDFSGVLDDLERHVGKGRIRAMHLNDCRLPFGSRKDRHADLGEGEIGWSAIEEMLKDHRLQGIPVNLETPGGVENYGREIAHLRTLIPRNTATD